MDVAAASVIMSQSKLQESVSILVLDKAMDVAKQGGQLVDQMIAEVELPKGELLLGNNVDKYV